MRGQYRNQNYQDQNNYSNQNYRDQDNYRNQNYRDQDNYRNQNYQDQNNYRNQNYQDQDDYDNQNYRDQDNYRNQNYRDQDNYRNQNNRDQDNYRNQNNRDQDNYRNQNSRDQDNYRNQNSRDQDNYRNQNSRDQDNYRNQNSRDQDNYRNQNYRDQDNYRNQNYQDKNYRDNQDRNNQGQNLFNRNNNNNVNQYMNNQGNSNSNQRKGKLEYLTSTLTATIIEYTEKHIDNSPVIFYRIKVTDHFNNNSWVIEKRYNDFSNLQKKLVTNFPDVPKIPGKTFFRVSDFASIKKRKDGLQYFLKTCVNRKDIFSSEDFKNFLELAKNSPDLCGNSPDMQGNFSLSQGVRDFQYIPEDGIIVLCTEEMNLIDRAESKITDLKNKIEKQEDITNPQGYAYVFRVEQNNGDFNFRETWRRKFKSRTRCIYYDVGEKYLLIGRNDGFISIHSVDKESRFKRVDLALELKNHLSQVNGVWYDPLEKKIYSVSTDKKFVASDINYNSQITEIARSPFDYTCLKPDIKYDRIFTASEGGIIEIFSIKRFPPNKICSTSITGVGNIRDIFININQFYIFACDNKCKITVLDFGSANSNNNNNCICSEISQFGGKTPLRAIIYDENKKELITGDETGKIVVWSIKTGQPIFSWAAHDNNSAITRLYYDQKNRVLISGAKDKIIKFWKLPDNWVNSDVLRFENEELKKINNEIARRRIKAQQEIEDGIENDFDSDLSQEDDLNGWNYRKDK
jgi:WD40 repeat protein